MVSYTGHIDSSCKSLESGLSRERVLQMIGDVIRDEPMEFILAVAETAPDQLGRAAELLAAVYRARGERSSWVQERESRARSGVGDGR